MAVPNHASQLQAAAATYSSAASAGVFWGLHLSDLGVIISSLAAVVGAVVQVMLYLNNRKETTRGQAQRSDPPGDDRVL